MLSAAAEEAPLAFSLPPPPPTPPHALQADTLQSVFVSLITLALAVPLFVSTGHMLLQAAPAPLRGALERARREASVLEGVVDVADEHFWSQAPGVVVGSLVVRTRSDADTRAVLERVRRLYRPHVQHLTVQVEREPDMGAMASMAAAGGAQAYGGGGGAGAGAHGHAHGGAGSHGHAHGGAACEHSHGSHAGGDSHGHSHGGQAQHAHSHGEHHGHSHA